MEGNYVVMFGAAILAMVVGAIWYGPLFGRKWMEIIGATALDKEKRAEMQKAAMPFYAIQFALTLMQLCVLNNFIGVWGTVSGIQVALWVWIGFIVPTLAGTAMWNNNSNKVKLAQFLIQAGYQLVIFVLFGYILGVWG